jgi:hypothetical protein
MSDVDNFRDRLYLLAARIERYCDEIDYDANDRDLRLDLLDVARVASELSDTVRDYVQSGEEAAYAVERRKAGAS